MLSFNLITDTLLIHIKDNIFFQSFKDFCPNLTEFVAINQPLHVQQLPIIQIVIGLGFVCSEIVKFKEITHFL